MPTFRTKLAIGAAALAAAGLNLPAAGQDRPESLLPPGFGDPVAPAPSPSPAPAPTPGAAPAPAPSGGQDVPDVALRPPASSTALIGNSTDVTDSLAEVEPPERFDLPEHARRPLSLVGAIGPSDQGLPANAFGRADGGFLQALMRQIEAPVASRWLSIALRRALVSQLDTPARVNGADYAAERAWLLLRMGEADAARGVVQSVDNDNYTPKLYAIAMQTTLAMGDPAGLCPVAPAAHAATGEQSWLLARAMCAGLEGEPATAGALLDQVRRKRGRTIDVLLAEKVAAVGANSRRAVSIQWDGVDQLTAWRFGLATATGVAVPPALYDTVGRHVQGWRARAPMIAPVERMTAAPVAATLGVLSSAGFVDLYSMVEEDEARTPAEGDITGDLRDAYAAGSFKDRVAALQRVWAIEDEQPARFDRLVLTARAAGRIPADAAYAERAGPIIASMLTAGYDRQAMTWNRVVAEGSLGWGLLTLADPAGRGGVSQATVERFVSDDNSDGELRSRMLFAGLVGLGRMSREDAEALAPELRVAIGTRNSWTRALDRAVEGGEPGTVLLLAAAGMQTSDWRGVPPHMLYRIVDALNRVGLNGEARMIAAEAVSRV